ncbi:hypothetical protein [Streptomyces orinoci]|uniref:Secreted protein n=1 Tax=Streptomyces orinoci TaxID=67339 RepID=A0ABV3JRE6_STRON|nr:hypothetical protein [Streptomyces orinoci]
MPQRRRPTTAAALALLLLAVLFAPSATGIRASADPAPARATLAQQAHPDTGPRAGAPGSGGSCRPLDLPVKGTEAVLPHAQPDPLTTPGATRAPLAQTHPAPAGPSRAPPPPVAGRAALLPVLRI